MQVALIGYSGHSYVVAEILALLGHDVVGYFERAVKTSDPFALPYLGCEEDRAVVERYALPGHGYALAVGDNRIRARLDAWLRTFSWSAVTAIHPRAVVSAHAVLGAGTVVSAGALVNALAETGRGCILNTGSIVEHECRLGDYVHVAPGAALGGNVTIGEGAFIGINAAVKQGTHIGGHAVIGAGAVVLRDVPPREVWAGVPARRIAVL